MSKKPNIKKSYNRVLQISEDAQQITLPDSRYYRRNGEYYPSVTYVLSYYPKGKFFEDWLKKVGYASEHIVQKAAEEGTAVHEMVESYLNGEELNFLSQSGYPQYNPDVWQMFLRFVEFWETFKPTLIETEVHIFSDILKVAGTCDLIIELDNKRWLLDIKTSNQIQSTYELQTAVYGQCYEECYNKKIDKYGILWLKSTKRKSSEGKLQGKGWEIIESERSHEENLDIFKTVKKLFDLENPSHSPIFTEFRTKVQLKP
jgi:ATP-dependent exoDNAse (exonuclease V) beta subunit